MPREPRVTIISLLRRFVLLTIVISLSGCAAWESIRGRVTPPSVLAAEESLRRGDRARAVSQIDAIAASNPKDHLVYLDIVAACSKYQQYDLTAKYALIGADKIPTDQSRIRVRLLSVAGNAYDRLGEPSKMIAISKQALQVAPNEPEALNGLGYAYAQAGSNLNEAVDLITRAIRIAKENDAQPAEIGAYVDSLGWTYYKLKRTKDAIEYLSNAAELTPDSVDIQYHLAVAYRANGSESEARVCLLRAKALEPDNPVIKNELKSVDEALAQKNGKQPAGPAAPADSSF